MKLATKHKVRFNVNGETRELEVVPSRTLLDVLIEDFRLAKTKEGCSIGECGACTVSMNGKLVCSCLVPLAQARGAEVVTIEGLGASHPLQRAFVEEGGAQCGACTPGMIMAALALPPNPTLKQVRTGLAGNLCRCTGYEAIYRAVSRQPSAVSKEPSAVSSQVSADREESKE